MKGGGCHKRLWWNPENQWGILWNLYHKSEEKLILRYIWPTNVHQEDINNLDL